MLIYKVEILLLSILVPILYTRKNNVDESIE